MKLEENMKKIDRTTDPLYLDTWLSYFKPKFKESFDRFFRENGHYPVATEIDNCDYLPSTRLLQRNYGGLSNFRKALGLEILDYTKGEVRKKTVIMANKRANENENEVYKYLVEKFGEVNVHREHRFTDGSHRSDFYIFKKFIVDVFYPKNKASLFGCLNVKIKKYNMLAEGNFILLPVIFLQMNKDLSPGMVKKIVANKKNKLHKNQSVMCIDEFKDFCNNQ